MCTQREVTVISISNISKFDFEKVPVDPFWNNSQEKELSIHRIHAYPAKFPAFITTKSLDYAKNNGYTVKKIGDIFCGCGTTALEAKRNGINFWGCDINPVATLIAKVKSQKLVGKTIQHYFDEIIKNYYSKKLTDQYESGNERLRYWYKKTQFNELAHLKDSILESTPNNKYRDFFLCAFSNILKPTSVWLTKSIKPQVDPNKKPGNVIKNFEHQFKLMFKANEEVEHVGTPSTNIKTGNFLKLKPQSGQIDMLVTSPPYVTSYEYADLHQLSSLWLGYTDDYKELRNGTIGSMYQDYNFKREFKQLNNTGFQIVSALYNNDRNKSRSVAKYFLDMQKVASKSYRLLSENGLALFVIGNTEYKEVRIDNAKHLAESLSHAGFKEIQVTKRKISNKILTPYRDKNGKFTKSPTGKKVYSEEFIIIGKK